MNWQIVVGIFFIICSVISIKDGFSVFLTGILIGAAFLYFGLKKKGYISGKSREPDHSRTLHEETFHAVGIGYYESNIGKLACVNPNWNLSATKLVSEGKVGKKIFHYNYINKPIKLVPEPENIHDKNAISVYIAGELVGYISREDNLHVHDILDNHKIIFISGFIGGGEYKIVSENKDVFQSNLDFTVNIRIGYI